MSSSRILFISNLKKPACASKQNVLELATLRYLLCSDGKLHNLKKSNGQLGFISMVLEAEDGIPEHF